jgi:hypothetical protein
VIFTSSSLLENGELRVAMYDGRSSLPGSDRIFYLNGMLNSTFASPDGSMLLLRTGVDGGQVPGDIVALSLNTGRISRFPLPVPTNWRTFPRRDGLFPANTDSVNRSEYREIVATLPQGTLLVHHWYAARAFLTSLELLDPTGRLTTVTHISGTVSQIHVIEGPPGTSGPWS